MWILPIAILVVTTLLAIPLSKYLSWIMDGKYHAWAPLRWIEATLNSGPQNWKQYTLSLLLFNSVLFVFGFIVLSLQPIFPLNDLGRGMLAPSTIFHSVISFMTNTDLQHYSGDQHFSNFSQIFFCLTNFFLSASIGFCGLTAIIRSLRSDPNVGNFFVDMWRVVMYTFLPVAFILAIIFLEQGSPDDIRQRAPGFDAGSQCNGDWGQRAAKTADDCGWSIGGVCADEAAWDERRGILWDELSPTIRESNGPDEFPFVRRDDALSVFAGADVWSDVTATKTRNSHIFGDDGTHDRHGRVGDLFRYVKA